MNLFEEFPPVSTEQWEAKILEDLKGADYEKKLIWSTYEGIKIKPYYRSEHVPSNDSMNALPETFPYNRGYHADTNLWRIREEIVVSDVKKANEQAHESIARGAKAISFRVGNLSYQEEIDTLLKGIDLESIGIHFFSSYSYSILADLLIAFVKKSSFDIHKIKGSLNFDSIAFYLKNGYYYNSKEDNFNEAASLYKLLLPKLPSIKYINVNGYMFYNSGATAVQELAYVTAMANEYLVQLTDRGLDIDDICEHFQLTFAIGSNYFMEIAKLRAARMLWSKLIEQYQPKRKSSYTIAIHAISGQYNKSIYDPYVNLLRLTTECMSAAIGGAGAITLLPFNESYQEADEFSKRMARNIQIILKEESYLDKVVDPAGGSYYIEALTDELGQYAWEYFKKIEEAGGFMQYMESGKVKEEIEKIAAQRNADIASRKIPILGTNIFPNLNENMLNEISKIPQATETPYLKAYRGAEVHEEIRLATEKSGKKPVVFLATYGNLAMRKARATFASNFFGCAGYEIFPEYFSENIEATLSEIKKSNAAMVVVCSSDDEYGNYAPELIQAIKKSNAETIIVVAGYPKESLEALKNAGADDFIHVRVNVVDTLIKFQKQLGIM